MTYAFQTDRNHHRWDYPPVEVPARPWWWWLAVGIVAALFGVEAWLVFRAFAGWPAGTALLMRLAG